MTKKLPCRSLREGHTITDETYYGAQDSAEHATNIARKKTRALGRHHANPCASIQTIQDVKFIVVIQYKNSVKWISQHALGFEAEQKVRALRALYADGDFKILPAGDLPANTVRCTIVDWIDAEPTGIES